MASSRGKNERPVVVVTGRGIITSLGAGKADNWAKLTAGESGIHRITRFANEGLKTTIAGSVDFVPVEPFCSTELGERMATMVAGEAISEARIGSKGDFPGPLFLAVAPVEIEWPHRDVLAAGSGANDAVGYDDRAQARRAVSMPFTNAVWSPRSPSTSPRLPPNGAGWRVRCESPARSRHRREARRRRNFFEGGSSAGAVYLTSSK